MAMTTEVYYECEYHDEDDGVYRSLLSGYQHSMCPRNAELLLKDRMCAHFNHSKIFKGPLTGARKATYRVTVTPERLNPRWYHFSAATFRKYNAYNIFTGEPRLGMPREGWGYGTREV